MLQAVAATTGDIATYALARTWSVWDCISLPLTHNPAVSARDLQHLPLCPQVRSGCCAVGACLSDRLMVLVLLRSTTIRKFNRGAVSASLTIFLPRLISTGHRRRLCPWPSRFGPSGGAHDPRGPRIACPRRRTVIQQQEYSKMMLRRTSVIARHSPSQHAR